MSAVPTGEIPAHVPAHLVRNFEFQTTPGHDEDPFKAYAFLHEGPDIFFAPAGRSGPAWIVTRAELMREILQNPETFSSKHIAGFSRFFGESWDLIPLEKDPPIHSQYRTLMNPLFAPARINEMEADVRDTCVQLIEKFRKRGECEFVKEFGRPFPVTIFLSLMGLPLEQTAKFLEWEDGLLHAKNMEQRINAARAIKDYLLELIADRRGKPVNDLASFAVNAKIDGRALSDEEIMGICYLLFVGGLDTVAATLGFTFRQLALDPDLQKQLRDDPAKIIPAMEEMLRAHAVVVTARFVTKDTAFHGVVMKQGDCIAVPLGLSGRDEREFTNPHEIDFDRDSNRHMTFATGPHRCIGSHLARREIKIALEEWIARIPEFRVKAGEKPITHGTGVWGVDYLPLVWKV